MVIGNWHNHIDGLLQPTGSQAGSLPWGPGITVMVVAINWNDPALRAKDDTWFRNHVRSIRDVVGQGGVLFEPVAEPGGDAQVDVEKALRWETIAVEEWGSNGLILNRKLADDSPHDHAGNHDEDVVALEGHPHADEQGHESEGRGDDGVLIL